MKPCLLYFTLMSLQDLWKNVVKSQYTALIALMHNTDELCLSLKLSIIVVNVVMVCLK